MAKRFQPMKEFGRNMKKPKLDITINRGPAPSTSKASSSCQNNFWDDDDDDVILLASQVADAAVKKTSSYTERNNKLVNNNMTISETEITFSEFASTAATSTQNPTATYDIPGADILSQMFDDDEDDDFMAAVEKQDPGVFKKPMVPPHATLTLPTVTQTKQGEPKPTQRKNESEDFLEFRLTQNTAPDSNNSFAATQQSAARRQQASEKQIKFLMEKVDSLKKENSKISSELAESKSKIESKEGEVSLLRDELRHLKQQAQSLKMEKIFSTEAARGECQLKIAELAKKLEAQQAEIRLREAQTSRMRMKQADETQKLQQSMVLLNRTGVVNEPSAGRDSKLRKCLMKMHCLELRENFTTKEKQVELFPPIFDHSLDKGGTVKRKTIFEIELETIQTLLAQLQLFAIHEVPQDFILKCLESASKVLPEFWAYTQTLYFLKYCEVHPYHNYSLSDSKINPSRQLQQPTEIYERERCLCFRRYIAILATMCEREPSLSMALLQHKHGEYFLLQIATDSIVTLGFACGVCEHFGVLEAFSVWLKSLLRHISVDSETNNLELLFDLMKHIVFTRPCAWIFREISLCLFESCRLPQLLNMLCTNSPEKTFVADRVKSSYRFSNDSCFMQVYCGLLEIAFPLSTGLHIEHFKLLVDICLNHTRFTYHCFIQPPKFVHKIIPIYDDEDDDDEVDGDMDCDATIKREDDTRTRCFETTEQNSTAKSVTDSNTTRAAGTTLKSDSNAQPNIVPSTQCECYIKMCLSVVTLVFQLLRQWFFHKMEYCTDEVAEISRLSVQLLHMIFCDYYLTCLFRDSEATTKYYLSLITKWWTDNAKKLNFNEIDLKFLQKIQNSHFIPKDIVEETNLNTVIADLTEWQNITKDSVGDLELHDRNNSLEEAQKIANKLQLIEIASKEEKFFEVFKGYAFNFQ
ncbi:mutagen-sensitive 304 [Haematobia irritans]|uniref:mutagen-sensitive 304 n=1 Tax=Haematobia irritans TaxID=7368 RepID=UPI003F504F42